PTLDTNKLSEPERQHILITVGITLAALFVVYTVGTIVRRLVTGHWRALETIVALNKGLFLLFTVPVVAALRLKDVELQSPKLTPFWIPFAAALSAVTFYQLPSIALSDPDPDASPRRQTIGRLLRIVPPILIGAFWVFYGLFFSRLAIINHHALVTR